jgi:hypothetical protein
MSHGPLDAARSPLWAELIATALVGTDRRTPTLPLDGGALGDLLGRLGPGEDAPGALLGAAAAVALYRRAGWLPTSGIAEPFPPCPPDDLPPCSRRAGGHLAQMLSGAHAQALPEWLAALAAAGRGVPPALLPALLDHGLKSDAIRSQIAAVLGSRGRWLAGLNPDWDYAIVPKGVPAEETVVPLWETSSRTVRLAILSLLRAREPNRARELLAASWASEKVDERAAFLETFAQGLSMADEPFLEQALDDRAERVRRAAAELLSRLPGSAFAIRMAARAAQCVRWEPGLKPHIEVTLPDTYDKAMQRDGIVRKPTSSSVGEKAWWLGQMLELTPPVAWCDLWGVQPMQIVGARMPREWRGLLLAAWSEAARRHADQTWLEALIAQRRAGSKPGDLSELLPYLAPARREQIALELLQGGEPLASDHPALAGLRSLPGVWSQALARAALAALRRRFMSVNEALRTDWHLRAALEIFAARMPANLANEAAVISTDELRELPYWGAAISQFEELMRFRDEMLRALRDV